MSNGSSRSHRNLGPIQGRQGYKRNFNPSRDARSFDLDDYHNFGGEEPSKADGLSLKHLHALADLIENAVAVDDGPRFLNAPDEHGNGGVGAGYTYLFQLAAHDLVDTQVAGLAGFGLPGTLRNLQRRPLALETLFGTGPVGCPFAYDTTPPVGHVGPYPARLRCGRVRSQDGEQAEDLPMHDLPRVAFDPTSPATAPVSPETVLIADARNDDNLILGQLTALFLRIYNFFVQEVATRHKDLREEEMEELARSMLVRIYRRILRYDLLAKILHPEIYAAYTDVKGPPVLDTAKANGTPSVEFALAAARLGHTMVRGSYQLNLEAKVDLVTVLSVSSRHQPGNLPLPSRYLVDWEFFFPPAGKELPAKFNWAIRLGLHVANAMKMPLATETPGPDGIETMVPGTVFRDLAREASGGLQSVQALLKRAMEKGGTVAAALGAHDDPSKTKELITARLNSLLAVKSGAKEGLTDSLLIEVAEKPPLSLFLQFEAEAYGSGGSTLGPLGSVLVAEAMWPVFSPEDWENGNGKLDALENKILGMMPKTMPELLAALADKPGQIL